MKKRTLIWIAFGIVIFIAVMLRFYRFSEFVTFLGDQGRDAIIVKRIITFEHFPAIGAPSSVGQIYLGPFYYYYIAPFLLLFNFNPVGLAYGVAFTWIVGIIGILYAMVKKYGALLAFILTSLTTFSFPLIDLSRFSWNPNLLPLFAFGAIYFEYKWLTTKKWYFAFLFGAFIAYSIQLHYLALLLLPTLGLFYLFYFPKTIKFKHLLPESLVALGSFCFFSLPLLIFDLKHNFLNAKNFIALFTGGKVASEQSYLSSLIDTTYQFMRHALQFDPGANSAISLFFIIIAITTLSVAKSKSRFLLLNLMTVIIYIVGFAALSSARHMHYYGPIYISFYLLLSSLIILNKNMIYRLGTALLIVGVFMMLNVSKYPYFTHKANNQIELARDMANSFKPYIKNQPIQIVTVPFTETHGHYRYFLEINGYKVLSESSFEQPTELYVMCFQQCVPQDDPQWQIAAFKNKKLETSWVMNGVTIYKFVHGTHK